MARVDGPSWRPVNSGAFWRVSKNAPKFTGRQLGPWTRAVNSGSGNRALMCYEMFKPELSRILWHEPLDVNAVIKLQTNKANEIHKMWLTNKQQTHCFTARRETYWNNHWIFMSQMSFLPLNIQCKSSTGKPVWLTSVNRVIRLERYWQ